MAAATAAAAVVRLGRMAFPCPLSISRPIFVASSTFLPIGPFTSSSNSLRRRFFTVTAPRARLGFNREIKESFRKPRTFTSTTWPSHEQVPILLVDAFTEAPFHGNPAAVCLLPTDVKASSEWMQKVAMEMNQAETAFLAPTDQSQQYSLRWFTPMAEVDLCGHATLASAKVLFEKQYVPRSEPIEFQTRSGILTARDDSYQKGSDTITLEFPNEAVYEVESDDKCSEILRAMVAGGVDKDNVEYIGRTRFDYFVVLRDGEDVLNFKLDAAKISSIGERGTIISSLKPHSGIENTEIDYIARFFAPQLGIPEDPVTGSAHCALGPYWGKKLHKEEVIGFQASFRGGEVKVLVKDDRVELKGGAVISMEGTLNVLVL